MLILFAVGVVTGTILSFELGLLWPEFMAQFGDVFGIAFALEGVSFFAEAIFIAIYVYGWDRLAPKTHFLTGIPIVVTGFTGSLFVIAVNGWMNQPTGFKIANGEVTDIEPLKALFNSNLWHELIHMYMASSKPSEPARSEPWWWWARWRPAASSWCAATRRTSTTGSPQASG